MRKYQKLKKVAQLSLLALALFSFTTFTVTPFFSGTALAVRDITDEDNPNTDGVTGLDTVAVNCYAMLKDSGVWDYCERIQDSAKEAPLSCAGDWFYEAKIETDPGDKSVTQAQWFTNPQKYLACVNKGDALLKKINDTCKSMRHISGDSSKDSPLWKDCEKMQNKMYDVFSCEKNFFSDPDRDNLWATNTTATAACKKNVDIARNSPLITSDKKSGKAADLDPPPEGTTGGGGASGGVGEAKNDCETKLESILSWISCPIIDQGVEMTDFVYKDIVEPLLMDVPVSTNSKDSSYIAWSQFRIIANILLIGSLLGVVYSQAKGGK